MWDSHEHNSPITLTFSFFLSFSLSLSFSLLLHLLLVLLVFLGNRFNPHSFAFSFSLSLALTHSALRALWIVFCHKINAPLTISLFFLEELIYYKWLLVIFLTFNWCSFNEYAQTQVRVSDSCNFFSPLLLLFTLRWWKTFHFIYSREVMSFHTCTAASTQQERKKKLKPLV